MTKTKNSRMKVSKQTTRQVIELSLENPDLGARRQLPLLRQKGVDLSESTVYRLMRQNGLNTREKRLARQEQQAIAAPASALPLAPKPPEVAGEQPVPPRPSKQEQPPVVAAARPSPACPTKSKARQKPERSKSRRRVSGQTSKFITLVNAALVLLAVFVGYRNLEKFLDARRPPEPVELAAETTSSPAKISPAPAAHALSDYRAVWERNLFNVSGKTQPRPNKEIDLAAVAVADKSIGLKLLGTVDANAEANRFAVIETGRGQKILHEGDTAGSYVIKKIQRNNVIIASKDGDKLLALKSGDHGRGAGRGGIMLASSQRSSVQSEVLNTAGGRFKTVELPREEIIAGLGNVAGLIRDVGTTPYRLGKLTGFKIDSVPDESILKRIGLRSHDTILAINGAAIKDESEAYAFFEKIARGEKVTIKYRRRNRTRRIELNPI